MSLTVSPVHDRHGHIIGASKTARDITTRKAWEDQLVRSEEAQRLLVGIHDATRGLQDPAVVMREIVTRVGLHFNVTRCAYGEVSPEQDQITITRGYTKDVPTVAGRYPLDVFGPLMAGELRAGRTVVDRRRPDRSADRYAAGPRDLRADADRLAGRACRCCAAAQLAAVLVMCDGQPREWTRHEAPAARAGGRAHAVCGRERPRRGGAARESRRAAAGDAGRPHGRLVARPVSMDTVWWSPEFADAVRLVAGRPCELQPRAAVRR